MLIPVVRGMALALGPDYEIVLHDVTDPDHSIVAIENGQITGRGKGDPLTDFGLFTLKKARHETADYYTNFLARAADGRRIRANTFFLRDEAGEIAGYLCVNYDMTKAEMAKGVLEQLTSIGSPFYSEHFEGEGPAKSVELLERNLAIIREYLGKPLHLSKKAEKLQAVEKLEAEGFFLLKGAVEAFAQESGVSVYTVYRYLRQVRGGGQEK
jgi:predicted transcriptional regulator YheO